MLHAATFARSLAQMPARATEPRTSSSSPSRISTVVRTTLDGQAHPDAVVETTSLSYAELPPITYKLALPASILQPPSKANPYGGALSNLQVDDPTLCSSLTISNGVLQHVHLSPLRRTRGKLSRLGSTTDRMKLPSDDFAPPYHRTRSSRR